MVQFVPERWLLQVCGCVAAGAPGTVALLTAVSYARCRETLGDVTDGVCMCVCVGVCVCARARVYVCI